MSDEKPPMTSAQPVASPPNYAPLVEKTQSHPVDPDMNNIYLSIFTMLFCCWPCGLVGLIYGIQGMQQYYRGQYDNAESTAKAAKKWTMCGIISGVIYVVSIIFICFVGYAVGLGLGLGLNRDK